MGKTIINGTIYSGDNITVINGEVFVDGQKAKTEGAPIVYITVEGNVNCISADRCDKIFVKGDVSGYVRTMSGDVAIEGSCGNVNTMSGDISASEIKGEATTMSGDFNGR